MCQGLSSTCQSCPLSAECEDNTFNLMLKTFGIKPTRQRLLLASLLFAGKHRHVTADELFAEAATKGAQISLATVYNTLGQFAEAGLVRELSINPAKVYFDTNVTDHHHFLIEGERRVIDIPGRLTVSALPEPPGGLEVTGVEVIVHVRQRQGSV